MVLFAASADTAAPEKTSRTREKFIGATAGVPYGTPAKRPMHSGAVRWSKRSMNEALDRDGGGFTAADAKRGNTAL